MSHNGFKAEGLTKSFGAIRVLDHLTLELRAGQVCVLVGANGAGKSTLLRICAGLMIPDSGQIYLPSGPTLSYLGHATQLYSALSVLENLKLTSDLISRDTNIKLELQHWGLEQSAALLVEQLSKGQAARVALCRALMHSPNIVLLDEPSSNLDDQAFGYLAQKLKQLKQAGAAILVASHDLFRIRALADRAVLLMAGKLELDGENGAVSKVLSAYSEANR